MYNKPLHAREANQVDCAAVMIKIRMAHDERIDTATSTERPRKRASGCDRSS